MYTGEVRKAIAVLDRARGIAESPSFSDIDRAQVLYHHGCCRMKQNSFATAQALYTQALELVERTPVPADRLRSQLLEWRSRCYRQARDFQAATEEDRKR